MSGGMRAGSILQKASSVLVVGVGVGGTKVSFCFERLPSPRPVM